VAARPKVMAAANVHGGGLALGHAAVCIEDEVVAGLQALGLSEAEAEGMVAWLGEDGVILLPKR